MQHVSQVGDTLKTTLSSRRGLSSRFSKPARTMPSPHTTKPNTNEEALWQDTIESALACAKLAGLEVTRDHIRRAAKALRKKQAHPLKTAKP